MPKPCAYFFASDSPPAFCSARKAPFRFAGLISTIFAVYMMVEFSFYAPRHSARNSHLGGQSTLGSKRVKFLMYNKPWKTGSTSIAERLKKCLVPQQYKLLHFEKVAGHQSIIPVSPVLNTASGTNMFAADHGLYNLAELEHIKERDDVDACYMTSVRDPVCYVAFGNDNISCCLRWHDEESGGHISLFPSL
jgi:hypothetical protein